MKIKSTLFSFLTVLIGFTSFAQTNTTSNGNWNTSANWSSGKPGSGDKATVYHNMISSSLEIKWGGHYTIESIGKLKSSNITLSSNGKLDANGALIIDGDLELKSESIFNSTNSVEIKGDVKIEGSNRIAFNINAPLDIKGDLEVSGSSEVVFNSNVHIKGELEVSGNSKLTVKSGDTLIVDDDVKFEGSVHITIEKDAVFIVNDEFEMKGNSMISLDGKMYVKDESEIKGSSKIYGNGSFESKGEVELKGSSSIFGSKKDCGGSCKYGSGSGLPIVLKTFTATLNSNAAIVSWTTATEINNNYFILEYSVNGAPFEVVAKIDGAGNSNKALNYKKEIDLKESGTHYFQLTQVDYDGKSETFPVIYLRNNRSTAISNERLTVYPNPSNGETIGLDIEDLDAGVYNINLANGYGNLILQNELRVNEEGSLRIENILKGQQLPKGIYYLTIYNQEIKLSKKIVVQ